MEISVSVSLGKFRADQEFTVVKNLSVECILGGDFLVNHSAVIDCRESTLTLGNGPRCQVPISIAQPMDSPTTHEESTVAVADTMVIPARSIMLIMVQVSRTFGREGFVQPFCTTRTGIPKSILVARTLGCVDKIHKNHSMVLEIANISPTPTKIRRGTKLGTFVPMDEFWVVNSVQNDQRHGGEVVTKLPAVDLTGTDLSSTQQQKLLELLATFSTLFVTPEEPLGKTSVVRHGI